MRPAELGKRLGVFLAVLVVAGGAAVALSGGSVTPAGNSTHPVNVSSHSSPAVIAEQPAEDGRISVDADVDRKVVVVDISHASDVDEFDLRTVVDVLSRSGHEVRIYEGGRRDPGRMLNATLRPADALLVMAPTRRFTTAEAKGVAAFAGAGGRVAVAAEPEAVSAGGRLGFGPGAGGERLHAELAPLASQFSMSVGSGYVYDIEGNNNFADINATSTSETPLTRGVGRIVLHEATPVTGPNVLFESHESAELSTTRRTGTYGVAARNGNVTILGDASILAPDWAYLGDNEVLVGNLLEFLVTGEKAPSNAPQPSEPTPPGR